MMLLTILDRGPRSRTTPSARRLSPRGWQRATSESAPSCLTMSQSLTCQTWRTLTWSTGSWVAFHAKPNPWIFLWDLHQMFSVAVCLGSIDTPLNQHFINFSGSGMLEGRLEEGSQRQPHFPMHQLLSPLGSNPKCASRISHWLLCHCKSR